MARKFFYVSLGILALALAYSLGAARTEAQGSTTTFVALTEDSEGGTVWDGIPIYYGLARYNGTVNVHIDGMAASIAL